jgi:hypothetical protein
VNFSEFLRIVVNFSDYCGILMWLQETSSSLPRERDPELGRVQGMPLSSSKVDYEILLYT